MNEPIGRKAYEAFRQKMSARFSGYPSNEWESLEPELREAWQAAAEAVRTRAPQGGGIVEHPV
jgi:hypothetical protein